MSFRLMSVVISSTSTTELKRETAGKLLKQLLECVQQCQRKYGGKTELATEFDSCVAGLCLSLEAVFLHGIKTSSNSTLKQVSDIVTNSLHIGNENQAFWPFIQKHLTQHERERYNILKHIWTDTGRGRAWIRASLNERSLERYFHIVLSNSELLQLHYEDWSLLRDQEKSSILPDMAAGIGSILFAISIDKPDLNSGAPPRPQSLKSKTEPVIEAPVINKREKKIKKKRKVAHQIISFDDEEMLSTSVPSSSSSLSSDNNSVNENQLSKPLSSLKDITEEARAVERKKNISIEKSGSCDQFASEINGPLTPVSQSEIGELTPVSVEINKNFDSLDISDEILEVPADISAVLSVLETKNNEELQRKQHQIDELLRENFNLKEQVKKYVGAVQLLRRDDETFQKALEGLQIENQPNYKDEAKIFEQKLVQVAEMHAELMDFNVMLQQQLLQKDGLLEKMKSELEELRGPMPSPSEGGGRVNIWIPSAFLTGSGSSSHHVYQIFLRAGTDEWNIYRRYTQFYTLHKDLKKLDPILSTFDFPPKKSIGKKDSALVEDRRKRLQIYLRRIIAHWPELAHCNSKFLLEQHLAFFKDQREVNQRNKSIFSPRRNNTHYTGL